jgi:hypothetical protein
VFAGWLLVVVVPGPQTERNAVERDFRLQLTVGGLQLMVGGLQLTVGGVASVQLFLQHHERTCYPQQQLLGVDVVG